MRKRRGEKERVQMWQTCVSKQSVFECSLHYSSNILVSLNIFQIKSWRKVKQVLALTSTCKLVKVYRNCNLTVWLNCYYLGNNKYAMKFKSGVLYNFNFVLCSLRCVQQPLCLTDTVLRPNQATFQSHFVLCTAFQWPCYLVLVEYVNFSFARLSLLSSVERGWSPAMFSVLVLILLSLPKKSKPVSIFHHGGWWGEQMEWWASCQHQNSRAKCLRVLRSLRHFRKWP